MFLFALLAALTMHKTQQEFTNQQKHFGYVIQMYM